MGRHGSNRSARVRIGRIGISATTLSLVILVLAVSGLGVWWWTERSTTDPIAAAPVAATATVVSSPACGDPGETLVVVSGQDGPISSVLDGCGFSAGQRIGVEYLAGHPETARLAGTSRAGTESAARRLVPIAIVVAGLALAAILVAVGQHGPRRGKRQAVSVAELVRRIDAARAAAPDDDGPDGKPRG